MRGLTIGGYKSTCLADLGTAYILENSIELFEMLKYNEIYCVDVHTQHVDQVTLKETSQQVYPYFSRQGWLPLCIESPPFYGWYLRCRGIQLVTYNSDWTVFEPRESAHPNMFQGNLTHHHGEFRETHFEVYQEKTPLPTYFTWSTLEIFGSRTWPRNHFRPLVCFSTQEMPDWETRQYWIRNVRYA